MILLQHTSTDLVDKLSDQLELQLEGVDQNQHLPIVHLNGTHVYLFSFGGDVIHKLSKDPQFQETAVPTLLRTKGLRRNQA